MKKNLDLTNKFGWSPATSLNRGSTVNPSKFAAVKNSQNNRCFSFNSENILETLQGICPMQSNGMHVTRVSFVQINKFWI